MNNKQEILQKIKNERLVAVIRAESPEKAINIIEACVEGGIKAIEITFSVPYAHEVITILSKKYRGGNVIIGAGTVLDAQTARTAILSGAQFIVSPYFNLETVRLCNRYCIPCIPGAMTIKEVVECMESGADIIKIFPADANGISFIKAIKGPLPQVVLMPTGGVNINNICQYFEAGAEAIGVGSDITKGYNGSNPELIINNTKEYVLKVNEYFNN